MPTEEEITAALKKNKPNKLNPLYLLGKGIASLGKDVAYGMADKAEDMVSVKNETKANLKLNSKDLLLKIQDLNEKKAKLEEEIAELVTKFNASEKAEEDLAKQYRTTAKA